MKKIRFVINIALGSMIATLGLTGCEKNYPVLYGPNPVEKYGVPSVDTTVRCMYGVNPNPIANWNENTEESL